MRPTFPAIAAALLALSACDLVKVERTPRGFYTQRDPARIDQQDASSEVRARVRNFAGELARGNRNRALAALNPTEDVLVIGSDAGDGVARIGLRGLAQALDSVSVPSPAFARTTDLRVQVGLHENTGWFSTPIAFMPMRAGGTTEWLRASGVYTQDRGEWKLVQLHLSRPFVAPDTTRADSASTDSARADTTRKDSARRGAGSVSRPDSPRRSQPAPRPSRSRG
ncbi:MAG TPA: nuclear transport factor 2 family protein [Longimicrobium sp.]|nr:nuclear transport factor 2 family protein [Longimicrobium sp.]